MQWTPEADEALLKAASTGDKRRHVAARLSAELGCIVTERAIHARIHRLAAARARAAGAEFPEIPIHWDDETGPITADRTYVEQPEPTYEYEPLDLGSRTLERVLLLPDTHAPFHDSKAWGVAMRFARRWQPDTVVHLGDWADCFTISDHDKDPRRASQLEDELKITHELRAEVDELPSVQRKIATLGNHEFRLSTYIMRNAPALMSMLDIAHLLELPQNGWGVVPYRSHGRIGKLYVTHEAGYAGVHAVHHTGNAFGSSVAFGHTHRMGCTYFSDVTGQRHVSASLGHLALLKEAKYLSDIQKRYWSHGIGTIEMDRRGLFQLQLVPIVDYRCFLNGEKVTL